MPKLDLVNALQIRSSAGEWLQAKSQGWTWAKPSAAAPLQQMAVHIDADIDTVGERDDISAMALWFASQDDFNIVGLTASCPDSRSQEYLNCIAAYEQDRDAMIANGADPALFKTGDDFRAMVVQGSRVDAPAKGYWEATDSGYAAPHAAAQALIANALAHGDPASDDPTRKLWVAVQGGYTTLAQALYESITLGQCPDILDRIRVVGQPNWNSSWAVNAWTYIFGNMWPASGTPGIFGDLWMLSGYLQWHAFNRDNGTTDTDFWNEITEGSFFGQHLRDTLTRPGAAFVSPHFRAGDAGIWFWLMSAKEQNNFDPTNPANLCGAYRTYEGRNPWPSQTVGYGAGSGLGSVPNPEGVTWSPTHWAPDLTVDSYADAYAAVNLTEWYNRVRSYMGLYQRQTVPAQVTGLSYSNGTLSWVAPHDGFSPITDYIVTIDGAVLADGTGTGTTADVSSLADGTYSATVAAVNAIGTGAASAALQFTVDSTAPVQTAWALTEGTGSTATSQDGRVATFNLGGSTIWAATPTRLSLDPVYDQYGTFAVADADSAPQDFMLGAVVKLDNLSGNRCILSRNGPDRTTQRQFQFRSGSGVLQFVAHTSAGSASTIGGGALNATDTVMLTFQGVGNTGNLRINGVQTATGSIADMNRTTALLGVSMAIGARFNPVSGFYEDDLDAQVYAFDVRFHSQDIASFEAGLRAVATSKGITLP